MHRQTRLILHTLRRRFLIFILLPFLLLLALRLIWGWEADHRLAATRAQLLAQGIRLTPPPTRSIPDNQNAALAVIDAVRHTTLSHDEHYLIAAGDDKGGPLTWTDAQKPTVRLILQRHAEAFQLLRVAAGRSDAQWPTSMAGQINTSNSHPIANTRPLANLLRAAALFAHEDGRDSDALDYIRLMLVLSRTIDHDADMVSHLVATAIRAIASTTVERMEPELQLITEDTSLATARELTTIFLDDHNFRDARALGWEISLGSNVVDQLRADLPAEWAWWIRPILFEQTSWVMIADGKDVPSVRADNWQATRALIPKGSSQISSNLSVFTQAVRIWPGNSLQYSRLHFRALADSGAAALLLGARIYRAQHRRYPANTQDFVPGILAQLPIDPFDADHRPMRYRLDATGPTVWSVSENGTDEEAPLFVDPSPGSFPNRYGGSSNPSRNPLDLVYGATWRANMPAR